MREYGIQLYSVRDAMKEDVRGTLKKIADMGYTSVEFAGFFGHSAEEIRGMLEETGLRISGTHSSFEDLRPSKIAETLAYHKAIGNTDYIVPGADLSTLEKIEDFQVLITCCQEEILGGRQNKTFCVSDGKICEKED